MSTPALWDIFCRVIDNHGDLGVCWRLSCQLAERGAAVRLWVDDPSALAWMAPHGQAGVQVLPWPNSPGAALAANQASESAPGRGSTTSPQAPTRVWLEAFGCGIPDEWIAENLYTSSAQCQKSLENLPEPSWINLEYLSAEAYVERCHRLPSPVTSGPARGLTRRFFYPGFTPTTGGLLREPDLMARQVAFDRHQWLAGQGLAWTGERVVSLFCYEPAALGGWLHQWAQGPTPTLLLVAPGRPWAAVQRVLAGHPELAQGALRIQPLPHLTQHHFDHLLWASDLNCVRGEDSLVRALWAGQPLVWHIYPQDDGAHWPKLLAFLDWLQAPDDLRTLHLHWNADSPHGPPPLVDWPRAAACVQSARARLLAQPDLVTQLLACVGTAAEAAQP